MKISVFIQCTIVLLVSLAASYTSWLLNIKTPLSLLWMVGIPLLLAVFCNEGVLQRVRIALLLLLMSFISIGITAAIIGYP